MQTGQSSDSTVAQHRDKPQGVSAIRKLLMGSVRLLVTAGLLWALLARADLSHAKELIAHVSLPLLGAGAAVLLATSPFSALRWHVVLAAETTSPGPWPLLKIVLVGLFFNRVLPSGAVRDVEGEVLGHFVLVEHGPDFEADFDRAAQRLALAGDRLGDARQFALGGGEQVLALAGALGRQRLVAANNQALAGESG